MEGRLAYGHRDAHGGTVGAIDPGVIRDGENERERFLPLQVVLNNATVEGLAQAAR